MHSLSPHCPSCIAVNGSEHTRIVYIVDHAICDNSHLIVSSLIDRNTVGFLFCGHWRIQGRPSRPEFFHFHAVFGNFFCEIIGWCTPVGSWCSLLTVKCSLIFRSLKRGDRSEDSFVNCNGHKFRSVTKISDLKVK